MSDLVKSSQGGLIGLLHGQGGGLEIPKPFEREVFLFDTYIAGTSHVEGIEELEPHLEIGEKLSFFREADNSHDPMAIVIKTAHGAKLGYVPRQDNVVFSRLMDAGKCLFGKISTKEMKGKWLKVRIGIYLQD